MNRGTALLGKLGKLAWFVICLAFFPFIVACVVVARCLDRLMGVKPWGSAWQYLWYVMWLD